jgi:glycosyltransferase involved in cell wall biosynthesis
MTIKDNINTMPELSLIVPVYNEEETLPLLFDGSRDRSASVLESLFKRDPLHVRVIEFRRNFGQTAAIAAGLDHARGEVVILLDADLQNDPADIPMMLAKLDEGYDVVSGWRRKRKDNALTRTLPSVLANGLISRVTGVHLHDYGCTLKAYRRDVLEGFHLYGEMHRFIPVFAHSVGARITEVEVNHHPRKFGKAKYGLERTLKVVLDLFTVKFLLDYSSKPIYLFGGAGLILMFLGLADLFYLFVRRFWGVPAATSPLLLVGAMFAIMGFQSILMGLIAELLVRTYHESQSKTTYRIRTLLESETRQ